MIYALLYHVHVRSLSRKRVQITLVPTWLGRVLKRRERIGLAHRCPDELGDTMWWWVRTDRYVGEYIERYIEAAPVLQIEDMSVEQLLLEDASSPKPTRKRS